MNNLKGNLYIVATPIGNLQDITLRALQTLKEVEFIVCEDSRVTGRLLSHFGIKKQMIALNEFNEDQVLYDILKKLEKSSIALVSDAGTPLISDPGYKLVTSAKKKEFNIIPIPGPTALIAALSASGLPTDKFVFLGFLPKSATRAEKVLNTVKTLDQTIIIYESPHRVIKTLETLIKVFGDIEITIARELTKIYEEVYSSKISELLKKFESKPPKGEFVILFNKKTI